MKRVVFKGRFIGLLFIAVVIGGWPMAAQAAGLGTAAGFAVLASKAVTCTGPNSNVTGPVGLASSTTAVTRTGCTMNTQVAAGAYADFRTAYNTGLGACGQTLPSTLPGVTNLPTGTYCTPAALTLTTGTLNLTGNGPWNFEIGTGGTGALTTTGFTVVSSNPCNVFWWVRQDVTLSTSAFQGTLLGGGDITLTDTTLTGRAWATGAATFTRSPILGCTAAGTVPGQCKKDTGSHEDGNSEQSDENGNADKSSDDRSNQQSVSSAGLAEQGDEDGDSHKSCNSGHKKGHDDQKEHDNQKGHDDRSKD